MSQQREIKFRAWDKRTKQVCDVWFINWNDGEVGIHDDHRAMHDTRKFEEIVFMQYTGLYDQNGTEIYEGDVVVHPSGLSYYTVNFSRGAFGVEDMSFEQHHDEHGNDINKWEVVGNEYENPELRELK